MNLKVFVASSLDQNNINDTFQWPAGFERTTELEDAEFIVFDVDNPPKNYMRYFGKKTALPIPAQNIPFFLVALSNKINPLFTEIENQFDQIKPPLYRSPAELYNALQWMQSIFPFYNDKKRPSKIDLAAALQALASLK